MREWTHVYVNGCAFRAQLNDKYKFVIHVEDRHLVRIPANHTEWECEVIAALKHGSSKNSVETPHNPSEDNFVQDTLSHPAYKSTMRPTPERGAFLWMSPKILENTKDLESVQFLVTYCKTPNGSDERQPHVGMLTTHTILANLDKIKAIMPLPKPYEGPDF